MNLDLGIIEEGIRNAATAAATPERADGASGFSRLLARQLGSGSHGKNTEDSAAIHDQDKDPAKIEERDRRPDDQRDMTARNPRGENQGMNAGAKEEPGVTPIAQESNTIPLGLAAWQTSAWPIGATDSAGLMTSGTGSVPGATDLPVTIQSRLAGEVAARFSNQNGVQNLTLKLNPDHLGKVEVTLQAKGNHLSVQITAGSRDAESALKENLRDLTDAIQNKTGRFQQVEVKVDLKSDEGPDQHDTDKDERQNGQGQGRGNEPNKESNQDKNQDTAENGFAAEPGMRNEEG